MGQVIRFPNGHEMTLDEVREASYALPEVSRGVVHALCCVAERNRLAAASAHESLLALARSQAELAACVSLLSERLARLEARAEP